MRHRGGYGAGARWGQRAVQARHTRHTNIRDQTLGLLLLTGVQKFLSRRVSLSWKARGFQQALQGYAQRIIIINNSDHCGLSLDCHATKIAAREEAREKRDR